MFYNREASYDTRTQDLGFLVAVEMRCLWTERTLVSLIEPYSTCQSSLWHVRDCIYILVRMLSEIDRLKLHRNYNQQLYCWNGINRLRIDIVVCNLFKFTYSGVDVWLLRKPRTQCFKVIIDFFWIFVQFLLCLLRKLSAQWPYGQCFHFVFTPLVIIILKSTENVLF